MGPEFEDVLTPGPHLSPETVARPGRTGNQQGSIEGYVRANGVTSETIEALRDALLER